MSSFGIEITCFCWRKMTRCFPEKPWNLQILFFTLSLLLVSFDYSSAWVQDSLPFIRWSLPRLLIVFNRLAANFETSNVIWDLFTNTSPMLTIFSSGGLQGFKQNDLHIHCEYDVYILLKLIQCHLTATFSNFTVQCGFMFVHVWLVVKSYQDNALGWKWQDIFQTKLEQRFKSIINFINRDC